jgi:hypothetical protein
MCNDDLGSSDMVTNVFTASRDRLIKLWQVNYEAKEVCLAHYIIY